MRSLYKVRDKRSFLVAALTELAGTAEVSFEGDLRMTTLFDVAGASSDETKVLKRGTLSPKQDFVVLPLESKTVAPIMAAVGGTVLAALDRAWKRHGAGKQTRHCQADPSTERRRP